MLRLVCGSLLAGALAVLFVQRHEVSRLRLENQTWLAEPQERERLARENSQIPRLRAETEEMEKWRHANKDLLKLRNEVSQLRRRKQELDRLRADNQRLRAEAKPTGSAVARLAELPGYVARANWANTGFATPEATVQTFFWSARETNFVHLLECMSPGTRPALEQEGGPNRNGFDEFRRVFGSLKGYRIAEKAAQGDSKVVLGIQAAAGGETLKLPLRRFGSEWKIDGWGE